MIKIYFDWNVISQMKNGHQEEIKEIVFNNDFFFIPYSTSHISDIFNSFTESQERNELIKQDLDFISSLTNNFFLFNDGQQVVLDFASPNKYYRQKIEEKDLFDDLSIDSLFKSFRDDELLSNDINAYLETLKKIPLDSVFKDAFENPQSSKQMELLFPGLKENLTMDGFFKSFGEMLKGLNEGEKYKELRGIVQSGLKINRDKIFDGKSPYQIIHESYKKIGKLSNQHISNRKNAPEWFNDITNEYIALDIHGYQEDKVSIFRGRKETFKNTTEDSFHSAFASTCNFYVINDKKSYKKTKQVYEKLKINTLVFKPDEFIEYFKNFLNFKDNLRKIEIIFEILDTGKYAEEQLESGIMRVYDFPYFLFNFFNNLATFLPKEKDSRIILLSQNRPKNGQLYTLEITKLVNEISALFGKDIDNYGIVTDDEFKSENWIGRRWIIDALFFSLVNTNGHIQLYIIDENSWQSE